MRMLSAAARRRNSRSVELPPAGAARGACMCFRAFRLSLCDVLYGTAIGVIWHKHALALTLQLQPGCSAGACAQHRVHAHVPAKRMPSLAQKKMHARDSMRA